jgi:hypothetical protein
MPKTPLTLENAQAILAQAWCAETAMVPATWSPANPSQDQCAVTAALLYERLGLPVTRGQAFLPDGTVDSHYWNGAVDFTATQYPDGTKIVERDGPQGEAAYAYLLTNPDVVRRLERLRAKVDALLTA